MTTFDAGPLVPVEVVAADGGKWTLVFRWDFRQSPGRVWSALTDPDELRQWAPYTADRDLGTVGDATLTMVDGDRPVDLPAVVRVADEPDVLEHTWGDDLLRWELISTDAGTLLTLRHTVAERDETPKYAAGWHLCLAVAARHLADDPVGPIVGERAKEFGWDTLRAGYAERLGLS